MFRECGILPTASVKTFMAADPVPFVINLKAAFGVPDIHFFTDILVRDRVILEIYGDVVVQLNRSRFPLGELVWIAGKRLQKREFFFQEHGAPATVFLLERGVIEPVQFLADCSIHCMDVKKFPIPQAGDDVGSQVSNAPLDRGFVAGC